MYDLLNNRTAWWAPGKIVELRRRLEPIWRVRTPAHAAQGLGVRHCHGLQRCTTGLSGPHKYVAGSSCCVLSCQRRAQVATASLLAELTCLLGSVTGLVA